MNAGLFPLIGLDHLSAPSVDLVMERAHAIEGGKYGNTALLRGCVLAPLFFQESSRTFLNSTSSFMKLGGSVLPISIENTRLNKAWSEPIRDFCQLINSCASCAIVRSPDVETVLEFARWCEVPMINAGNGVGTGSEHPMQTLVDLYIIRKRFGSYPINLLMIGGRHIRTTRTQTKLFKRLGFLVDLIPSNVQIANTDMDEWYEKHCGLHSDIRTLDLSNYQVIYSNGADEDAGASPGANITLNHQVVLSGGFKGVVMHSLPRLAELSHDLDDTPFNAYFQQMRDATFVYQAVFSLMREQQL